MALRLTKTDVKLIAQLDDGHSTDDIAKSTGAKAETVKGKIDAVKQKFGVTSKDELVAAFRSYSGWAGPIADWPASHLAD